MSSAAELISSYRRACQEDVTVRRYTGVGASRTYADTTAKGRLVGYTPQEIIGSVQQGDRRAVVIAQDIAYAPTSADFVVDGRECKIMAVLPRKALDGTVVAYELQVRG